MFICYQSKHAIEIEYDIRLILATRLLCFSSAATAAVPFSCSRMVYSLYNFHQPFLVLLTVGFHRQIRGPNSSHTHSRSLLKTTYTGVVSLPPLVPPVQRNRHVPVTMCGHVERNPGQGIDGEDMPSVSAAIHCFEAMDPRHPEHLHLTPSKDPLADATMDAATDDKDGPDMSPVAMVDLQECPSPGYPDEYTLDLPANAVYHTAFEGIMSTLQHFQFTGDTQWAVSSITAHLPQCIYLRTPPTPCSPQLGTRDG